MRVLILFQPSSIQRLARAARLMSVSAVAVCLSAAVSTDALIDRVEHHYNAARTLSVHFVESYSILGHGRPPESGRLTLRKQGKMRWQYDHPAGKVFLSDGKTVYLYTAADNRVEKVPMKETDDMRAPLGFLLGKLDLRKEFRQFTATPEGDDQRLHGEAKGERTPYESIDMRIGPDGAVQELNVKGRDQSLLSFVFSDEVVNPSLPDSMFHFAVPAGAQVVDAVEAQPEVH